MPLAERDGAFSTVSVFFLHGVEAMPAASTISRSRRRIAGARVKSMIEILLAAMAVQMNPRTQKSMPEPTSLDLVRLAGLLVALSIAFACAVYQ